jgi:hypothetical protein
LLNEVNGRVELKIELGLIEGLLSETGEDFNDGVNVGLFNDDRVLQQDNFGFGQSNWKHILNAELREALFVE